jgi:hypothetical protein
MSGRATPHTLAGRGMARLETEGPRCPMAPGMPPRAAPEKRRMPIRPDEGNPVTGGPRPTPRRQPRRR